MTGEMQLETLLATMQPVLSDETYVFVSTRDVVDETALAPRMIFQEAEGTTYIVTQGAAEAQGLDFTFPSRMVTLDVHSALEAVGFLATVATRLAREGMGVNPVAGFYHDHLFVPVDRADDAMTAIQNLAMEYRS